MFKKSHNFTIFFSLLSSLFIFVFAFAEETITITSYYPSPYGSYYNFTASNNVTLATVSGSRVGIGTTATPGEKLEINGNVKLSSAVGGYGAGRIQAFSSGDIIAYTLNSASRVWDLISITSSNPDYFAIRDNTAGLNRFAISQAGNVGIGTTNPGVFFGSGGLHIFNSGGPGELRVQGGSGPGIVELDASTGGDWHIQNSGGVFTVTETSVADRLVIQSGGNVGIGTWSPGTDKLDVRGRAYASGGWQTTDADYAEWIEKEEDAEPGDIIGINLETGLARVYRPGDKIIGVSSLKPAIVGNRLEEKDEEMSRTHILVGLVGQLDFRKNNVVVENGIVKTKDNKEIGVFLKNGKVLIGI
ncbi:MAG: hypothetical protein ABH882_05585 [Candidatus Omnitrophota bacterium]|nr:hypothetical protein [Candidatus Omnitrophota bacterium]MBU1928521.1 hypothetical protein [Candidatus Omnitrophota bacterium]MBU2034706.1 hypothetical protein [Candidatus Omnitrophota bacterium]MBU2221012.1 hypothetical protein [Candidatus Omnitrophota bacterium]MBU2257565.1 hypothetical protein [Candidatus Omnitrophota bacterium]